MGFFDVLLNVLAIIGIVVIGGVVIYFLGSWFLSILDSKNKDEKTKEESNNVVHEKIVLEEPKVQQQEKEQVIEDNSFKGTISEEKFQFDDNEQIKSVDFEKAQAEKASLTADSINNIDSNIKDEQSDDINDIFNDDKDFNFDDFDFDSFFDEQEKENKEAEKPVEVIKEEVAEETVPETKQDQGELTFDESVFDTDLSTNEIQSEVVSSENTQVTNSQVSNTEIINNQIETTTITKTIQVENHELEDALRAEIGELKRELAEQKQLYISLKEESRLNQEKWESEKTNLEKLYEEAEAREIEKPKAMLTLEEYQARLMVLQERLRINEKELKLNRKEFLPLKRVRKNLDKDKSKLRRREALVAKQKVLLYGVNNIMEIDQEKAKKLAEDLDLLDGLKVSVRHCEEVMEANKERYPILETANRILTTTHEEIKADIEECENAIRELGGSVDNGETGTILDKPADASQPQKRKRGRPRKTESVEVTEVAPVQETVIHSAQTVQTDNGVSDEEAFSEILENTTELVDAKNEKLVNEKEIKEISADTFAENLEKENVKYVSATQEENKVNQEVDSLFEQTNEVENLFEQPQEKNSLSTQSQNVEVVDVNKTQNDSYSYEKTTVTKTKIEQKTEQQPHKFNYDADEPSLEDLFAIENENWFDDEE